ncbi:Ankyrin-1 [Phytophthora citrophthora]|uniref:Ankyrin-1 n=1 Tax=Phytophthora citrophthora TaxID=4793 RepID=A0AAD9GWC8_9STRA|nr:Ankyrin-1 [Phytophthora citrophthora]
MISDRAGIEARRRILVGSILAPSDKDQFIEASFSTHFGRNIPELGFWKAFDEACSLAAEEAPWHLPRQLMISHSLPQQVNGKDARGETMLTLAATFGRAKAVGILCQIKGDPRIENAKGWSTVHVAAAYSHVNVLEVLLRLGISMNEADSRLGYTPLHVAVSVDNVEVLKLLYESKKADFWKKARNGFSVLHVASTHGSDKCVKFLTETFPDMKFHSDTVLNESPAHKAAKHLHPHIYNSLTSLGTRDDLENIEGDSAYEMSTFNTRYCF